MGNEQLVLNVLKVFGLGTTAFFFGVFITPPLIRQLHKYKAWPKNHREKALTGEEATTVKHLREKERVEIPRLGGILVWGSTLLITFFFWGLANVFPSPLFTKLNFFSRDQTWIPIFALVTASIIGLIDDVLLIKKRGSYVAGGIALKLRIFLVLAIGFAASLWFFVPLEHSTVFVPFVGEIEIGILYIPFFMIVMLATFSGGIIDGLDGLSGGVFAAIFSAYVGITFFQQYLNLAAFLSIVVGAILAFLWFNIPPAKFYMGETGILGLTTLLTITAFFTNTVIVLPIIAFPLVLASGSSIIQITAKKFFRKKVFLAAPLHHHFEARGWTREQITMRFWVLSAVFAIIGMVIALIGNH